MKNDKQLELGFSSQPNHATGQPATGMDRARLWFAHIQHAIDRAVDGPLPEPAPSQSWMKLARHSR